MFMLPNCSLEKLLPDGIGEKNRKWAVMLALSALRVTSPAPGLYFFIVLIPVWLRESPCFCPEHFPWASACSVTSLFWHDSFRFECVCVCVSLYVHLFFQQNNIISLTFYLTASSIPPETYSPSEPPSLRSYLCFSGLSPDPMSAQTIPWQCRSRDAKNHRAWLIKETPAKIGVRLKNKNKQTNKKENKSNKEK